MANKDFHMQQKYNNDNNEGLVVKYRCKYKEFLELDH